MDNKAKFELAVSQFNEATETIKTLFKGLTPKDLTPELQEDYEDLYEQLIDEGGQVYYTDRNFDSCIGHPVALLDSGEIMLITVIGAKLISFGNLESLDDQIKVVRMFL